MTTLRALLAPIPPPLLAGVLFHLALAAIAAVARVRGAVGATKPLRFALSIALFLGTIGLGLVHLALEEPARAALAWLFTGTMTVEMAAIAGQALRGTRSHFNVVGATDRLVWGVMVAAILVASAGLVALAIVATASPMRDEGGLVLAPLATAAWRAGLWHLVLVPVSGFAMGSRMRHSVGGEDGGRGLPIVGFSVRHGDLRVPHFFALHAVQVLPASAWLLERSPLPAAARVGVMAALVVGSATATIAALVQALRGEPLVPAGAKARARPDIGASRADENARLARSRRQRGSNRSFACRSRERKPRRR